MSETSIAPEIHQPFVRRLELSTQVSLHLFAALDDLTNLINLLLGEIICTNTLLDAGLG
jgi:hypothetical protein